MFSLLYGLVHRRERGQAAASDQGGGAAPGGVRDVPERLSDQGAFAAVRGKHGAPLCTGRVQQDSERVRQVYTRESARMDPRHLQSSCIHFVDPLAQLNIEHFHFLIYKKNTIKIFPKRKIELHFI